MRNYLRTYETPIISDHEYAKLNVNQKQELIVCFINLLEVDHKVKQMELRSSWEICQRCAKILLAAEHKMQLA